MTFLLCRPTLRKMRLLRRPRRSCRAVNAEHHTYLREYQGGYGAAGLYLTRAQRLERLAALGASGVGKSSLLRAIAASDIARGDGILFIDV